MRNLKKLLAVVLTVVMIASMMVPALAANTYEAEALKLQSIGMFAGEPADLKLEEGVTRIQGLAFAIRAAGVEADAFAMTDEEVATILDTYVDGADVPEWGRKYAAYAIKNGITVGVSATEKKFAALDPISGTSFLVFLMKAGMGYADVTTATVVEASVEAGILTASQAAQFGAKAALIRDDAAGILYGAAMNGVNADGTPLIEALIASGFVDRDAALEAGFVEEVVPEELEVVDVTATNLIQAVVNFNQPVDEDTAGDEDNYDFATADKIKVEAADVSEDKLSVTLTFAAKVDQQKKAKLTISGVKSADGEAMEKVTEEVYFLDNTIPEILSVDVVGISTIKVTFSEPMARIEKSDFKVNNGKFYIQEVSPQKSRTEWLVKLYTSLKAGELPFEVKVGPADYAGFTAMGLITTLDVVEDKDAPVVIGYKDAKPNSVVLIWDGDIEKNGSFDKDDFYHTNKNNKIFVDPEIDGNEMKLTFDDDSKLPNGTAYVYVLKEAVKDFWNNKNAQQMVKIEVTVDDTAPSVTAVKVDDEDQITLTFDEELDSKTAKDKANYKLLDDAGKEVSKPFKLTSPISLSANLKKVTINFKEDLEGDYTLIIDGVEDTSENAMSKVAVEFTVDDLTPPDFSKTTAIVYTDKDSKNKVIEQYIIVNFYDDMATEGQYSVLDIAKYVIGSTNIEDVEDAVVTLEGNGKSVKIEIPHSDMFDPADNPVSGEDYLDIVANTSKIKIARVADGAGNYTPELVSGEKLIKGAGAIAIEKIELIGAKEVKVYFADELAKFDADDLVFTKVTTANAIDTVTTELKDGKTVATYTLEDAFKYDATDLYVKVVGFESRNSENVYGEKLDDANLNPSSKNSDNELIIKDKLAAAVEQIKISGKDKDNIVAENDGAVGDGTGIITIQFTEAYNADTITKLTFAVDGFKVTDVVKTNAASGILVLKVTEDADVADRSVDVAPIGTAITQLAAFNGADGNSVTGIEAEVSIVR